MSSVKKNKLIINLFILLALTLYCFSGFLPVAGAITNQGLVVEGNENKGAKITPDLDEIISQRPASIEGLIEKGVLWLNWENMKKQLTVMRRLFRPFRFLQGAGLTKGMNSLN